jgi:hypothetical protein
MMTVEIQLTKGYVAVVDDCDADLADFRWYANRTHGLVYAVRSIYRGAGPHGNQYIHRVVLERVLGRAIADGLWPDHINGDGLDNRRANLREASIQQNHANSKRRERRRGEKQSSEFRGVYWNKQRRKWYAMIRCDKRTRYLACSSSELEAARAFDRAALELYGSFARINGV